MNWGKGIVIAFLLFATFLAVMVTIMMRQDVDLVSTQYYKDDLAFQQQYERKQNVEALEHKPEITFDRNQFLKVNFHSLKQIEEGKLTLFRPSQDKLDQNFVFKPAQDSIYIFQLSPLETGVYRAKMTWKTQGKEYYMEQILVY